MVLFALGVVSTLAISSGDPLPNWVCEGGILLLAALVSLRPSGRASHNIPILIGLAAISLWGFGQLAVGATVYRYATLDAALRLAACGAVAFAASQVLTRGQRREQWLQWFCWFAVGLALSSVLAYYTSPGNILWIFPSAYPDNWGPFASRNNFAQFLELSFPVAVYEFDRAQSEGGGSDIHWVAGLGAAILFASGIASASRAGAAILFLEALCLAILLRRRIRKAFVGLVLATAALILTMGGGTLAGRLRERDPLSVRREIYRAAWNMIASHPWKGYGLGTFKEVYPQFAEFDPGTTVEHAHNDWLEWACDGGIPFAISWLLLSILIAPRALRSIWGVGILAVFLHATVDYPFAKLGVALWLFALVGCLISGWSPAGDHRPVHEC